MLKFLHYPMALTLLTAASLVGAQTPAPSFPDAARSDPVALGWMVGSPPPPDKLVQFADGSVYSFPRLRWSFSNFRQMAPTTQVGRGLGGIQTLPRREIESLGKIEFLPLGQSVAMNWEDSLAATYTDGIVVLHRGQVVYERYTGVLKPEGQHIAMSVTKSFFGV
ncbi:MAG: 6-aminohexanoate hydrolase, partial [Betaproteobacteria bacterium]|nr:6-aminohexanoate hydrolase [Betaproteobacteria bacterium]